MLSDFKYSWRLLKANPASSVIAIVTLALGIASNTAIFSVLNAILIRPLPFHEPERLVAIWSTNPRLQFGFTHLPVTAGDFLDWREQNTMFDQISVIANIEVNWTDPDQAERISGVFVSHDFFRLMGASPQLGRAFLPEEELDRGQRAVVISDSFWRRGFQSDPAVLGTQLTLEAKRYTIVGVAPPGFNFPHRGDLPSYVSASDAQDFWSPFVFTSDRSALRADHQLAVIARLKQGSTLEQAQSEMRDIAGRLEQTYPRSNDGWSAAVVPLTDGIVAPVKPALLLMMCAVAFVLLIACANVASLLLTRAAARRREIAIRAALGANRWRIGRQLLIESLIVSAFGGACGLSLGVLGVRILVRLAPNNIPRLDEVNADWRVVAFSVGLTIATGLLFGLVPAIQASRADLNSGLRDGSHSTASVPRRRAAGRLVVAEIAVSLVLLVGAGLMIKSFWRLLQVDPGFDPASTITISLSLSPVRYPQPAQQAAFYDRLIRQARALPFIEAVGVTSGVPLSGSEYAGGFSVEGRPPASSTESTMADRKATGGDYFLAMRTSLIEGRYFDDRDSSDAPGVAIVSRSWADRFIPGESAVGKRLKLGAWDSTRPWLLIVGVVGDVHQTSLEAAPRPIIYYPFSQRPASSMTLIVRTADAASAVSAFRREVTAIDKEQPITGARNLSDYISRSLAARRFNTLLLALFSAAATVIATVGVYGVMAQSVIQRTREMAIRVALGATPRDVRRLILRHGLLLSLTGLVVGLGLAFWLTRLMTGLMFQVSVTDPATFVLLSALLLLTTMAASYFPARRATQVDPIVALRRE